MFAFSTASFFYVSNFVLVTGNLIHLFFIGCSNSSWEVVELRGTALKVYQLYMFHVMATSRALPSFNLVFFSICYKHFGAGGCTHVFMNVMQINNKIAFYVL